MSPYLSWLKKHKMKKKKKMVIIGIVILLLLIGGIILYLNLNERNIDYGESGEKYISFYIANKQIKIPVSGGENG